MKNIPPQIRRTIGTQYLREAPVTLFFKFLCTRWKQHGLPQYAKYEFVSRFFSMTIRIGSPDSLSIAFEWMNGVRLDFPPDYFEDAGYTSEKLFSVLQLLYDTFSMRCLENSTKLAIPQYASQYKRSHMDRQWDQSLVVRKSARRDSVYLAVKALDPIASQGLVGFW